MSGASPEIVPQRQLNIGPAGWFRADPLTPAANQVNVLGGWGFSGALQLIRPNPHPLTGVPQDQLSAGFAVVAPGFQRYDLVYIDDAGVVQILQGTAVAVGSPAFQGAPGTTILPGPIIGPALPDNASPVAFVFVNEAASPIIDFADIAQINGFIRVTRDLDGFLVDKGFISVFAGLADVVTSLFTGESQLGSASVRGVITTPPLNVVHLLDQKQDQIIVGAAGPAACVGAKVYGRLTYAVGVWTLTYYALSNVDVETAINVNTDLTAVPTQIHLVGVPKVYARGEPSRPLFSAGTVVSDQLAGDIPYATTVAAGKVKLAANLGTGAGDVPQATDDRLGRAQVLQNGANPTGGLFFRRKINLIPAGGLAIVAVDNPGGDSVDVTITQASVASVPIGGVLQYLPPVAGSPPAPPTGFEYADGSAVTTVGSPIIGMLKPQLMLTPGPVGAQRHARGANFSTGAHGGGPEPTGGSDTGTTDSSGSHNHGGSSSVSGSTDSSGSHTHGTSTNAEQPFGSGTPYPAVGPTPQAELFFVAGNSDHNHPVSEPSAGGHGHNFGPSPVSIGFDGSHGHNINRLAAYQEIAYIIRVI